jgi:hypothetical protein
MRVRRSSLPVVVVVQAAARRRRTVCAGENKARPLLQARRRHWRRKFWRQRVKTTVRQAPYACIGSTRAGRMVSGCCRAPAGATVTFAVVVVAAAAAITACRIAACTDAVMVIAATICVHSIVDVVDVVVAAGNNVGACSAADIVAAIGVANIASAREHT